MEKLNEYVDEDDDEEGTGESSLPTSSDAAGSQTDGTNGIRAGGDQDSQGFEGDHEQQQHSQETVSTESQSLSQQGYDGPVLGVVMDRPSVPPYPLNPLSPIGSQPDGASLVNTDHQQLLRRLKTTQPKRLNKYLKSTRHPDRINVPARTGKG